MQKVNQNEKQGITFQIKGCDKSLEKQLNEVEISKLSEKEFRIVILKITQDLRKRMETMQEMFTKDLGEQNKQTGMNNTEEGINSRIKEEEEWIMTWRKEWWESLPQNRILK